jgi:ligand-binding SRPBCC domain-containing protein
VSAQIALSIAVTIIEFNSELWLPRPVDEVFDFFGDAANLQALTPSWLNLHVHTPAPIVMRPGTLIDYRLRIRGIPVRWQTEITVWERPHRFVDIQKRGPYRQWIHEHRFIAQDGGTRCRDSVQYAVPGGWLVQRLFVRRDVERIFKFRAERLREIFPGARNPE